MDENDDKGGGTATAELVEKISDKVKEKVTPLVQSVKDAQAKSDETLAAIKADVEQHKAEIRALAEGQRQRQALPGWSHNGDRSDPANPQLSKIVAGRLDGWGPDTKRFKTEYTYVHELQAEMRTRAQQSGIGTAGGVLIGTDMFPGIIDPLIANSVALTAVKQAGNYLDGLTGGPLHFNRSKGGITAHRKGESKPISKSEEKFDEMELRPLELVGLVQTSKKQVMQDNGALSRFLERRLGQQLGLRADLDFFKGGGGNAPVGILTTTAPAGTTTDLSDLDLLGADQNATDKLNDFIAQMKARDAYHIFGPCYWFGHPLAFNVFRNVKDADGRPIGGFFQQPYVADTAQGVASNDRFWGHSYGESTQLAFGTATDDLVFVGMGAAFVAFWNVIEILPNELSDAAYINNDLQIRAVGYEDSAILRGECVQRASGWDNS